MFKVRGTTTSGKEFSMTSKSALIHEAVIELTQQLAKAGMKPTENFIESVTFKMPEAAGGALSLKDKRERKLKKKETPAAAGASR